MQQIRKEFEKDDVDGYVSLIVEAITNQFKIPNTAYISIGCLLTDKADEMDKARIKALKEALAGLNNPRLMVQDIPYTMPPPPPDLAMYVGVRVQDIFGRVSEDVLSDRYIKVNRNE